MALLPMIDSLTDLHESIHEHYLKGDDGKFRLDVTPQGGMALEDVSGLRSGIEAERQENKQLKAKYKPFDGLDIDKINSQQSRIDSMQNWTPEQKVQDKIDASVAEVVKGHVSEKESWAKRETTLLAAVKSREISASATAAIVEAKGSVELLSPIVERQMRLRENEDGTFVTEIINLETDAARVNTSGQGMSVVELVAELKANEKYSRAFDGSGQAGSGGQNNGQNIDSKTPPAKLADNIDPIHRLTMAHENKGKG